MGQVEDGAVGLGMTTYVSPVQSITPKQKVMHVNPAAYMPACMAYPLRHRPQGKLCKGPGAGQYPVYCLWSALTGDM